MERPQTLTVLRELEDLLRSHQVSYGEVVAGLRARVAAARSPDDWARVATEVRSQFGGMGSLTDIWISKKNGHIVEDETAANDKLDRLRTRLWEALEDPEFSDD